MDALRRRPASSRWVTARRRRGAEVLELRTDYLFASPRLAERLLGADVVDVGAASDHHALTATFTEA
ncbi:hypothetical protein ACN28S_25390 [Cystobacter fuscus]